VDGSEFTGDRFAIVPHRYGRRKAEEELAKLPNKLTVLVNPRDPADAVVDRQGTGMAVITGCVGAVAMLSAVFFIFYR
jgi:hypothetical protein